MTTRDRGCTWPGCDAPPGWCDVAHGNTPFRHGGQLTLDNCALLCRRHHRRFDTGSWRMHIDGPTVTYHPAPAGTGDNETADRQGPQRPNTAPDPPEHAPNRKAQAGEQPARAASPTIRPPPGSESTQQTLLENGQRQPEPGTGYAHTY